MNPREERVRRDKAAQDALIRAAALLVEPNDETRCDALLFTAMAMSHLVIDDRAREAALAMCRAAQEVP